MTPNSKQNQANNKQFIDIPELNEFLDELDDDPNRMMEAFGVSQIDNSKESNHTLIKHDLYSDGDLMFQLGAATYSEKQALTLLDFLYTWFFGSDHGALVHAQKDELKMIMEGFGGVIALIHQIINSKDLHKEATFQLESLWEKFLSRPPTNQEVKKWLNPIIFDHKNTIPKLEQNLSNPIEVLNSMKMVFGGEKDLETLPIDELRKSLDMLERFVEEDYPLRWDFWEFRAILLSLIGNFEEAKSDFENAIKLNYKQSRKRSYRGLLSCLIELGKDDPQYIEDGLRQFLDYEINNKSDWMLKHALGKLHNEIQEYTLAATYFVNALENCDEESWGWTSIELYSSFNHLKKPNEALSFFSELQRSSDWGKAYALGHLYQTYKKDKILAIKNFEHSVLIQGSTNDFSLSLISLVDCLLDQKQLRKAQKYALEATNRWPNQYEPYFQLGKIYLIQNESDKSVKFFKLAATKNLSNPEVWYYLGIAVLKQNTNKSQDGSYYILADEALQKAKDYEPNESLLNKVEKEIRDLKTNPDTQLRKFLKDKLTINELRELCFDLAIDIDDIGVGEKSKIVLGLLTYMKNRNLKSGILDWLRENKRLPPLI